MYTSQQTRKTQQEINKERWDSTNHTIREEIIHCLVAGFPDLRKKLLGEEVCIMYKKINEWARCSQNELHPELVHCLNFANSHNGYNLITLKDNIKSGILR